MKMKLLSLCLAVLMCIVPLSVFAESEPVVPAFSDVVITYDRVTGGVNISGKALFALNMTEAVRLMVLKPDTEDGETNIEKLKKGTVTFASVGVHVDETTLAEDKSFAFDPFVLSNALPVGDYTLRLAAENTTYTGVISVATVAQTVAAMNQVTDSVVIEKNIAMYNDVYQLSIEKNSAYDKLSEKGKSYVMSSLCNKTYADKDAIKILFDVYVQLGRVLEGPWGVLEDVIDNHSALLGLTPYMGDFDALEDKKDLVYKALSGNGYADASTFALAFNQAIVDAENTDPYEDYKPSSNKNNGQISAAVQVPSGFTEVVTPVTPIVPQKPFNDLAHYEWAEDSIIKLYEKGIINGKANGTFAPADLVTRGEAVKMIVLAFGEVDEEADCDFLDVTTDSWLYPYMATAVAQQIVYGYSDGTAGAQASITREDFATMILRAAKAKGIILKAVNEEKTFTDDASIAAYAKEAVLVLQQAGVINGGDDNNYLPKHFTKRAEAAKMIAALLD